MAHNVFISYPSEDKPLADAICAKLESNAIRCWIAPRDILPGQNYAEALLRAIDSSKIFILVFSKNTNSSPHIMSEVQRAFNHNRIIIPFRIENIDPSIALEYYIGQAHWLDAITPPIEAQIDKLVRVVKINLDPQLEGSTDISPAKNVIPDPVEKSVLKKFLFPLIILFLLVVCLGLFLGLDIFHIMNGINPSTPTPTPAKTAIYTLTQLPTQTPNRTQTSSQIQNSSSQRYAIGDIVDWKRSYDIYRLIVDFDKISQVYFYISIFKEQNYWKYDNIDLEMPSQVNQTEFEKDNPPIVVHLIKDKIPIIPSPTPIIYNPQVGKNKYGTWDWAIDEKAQNQGYIVYKYFPSSDKYEVRKVMKYNDGEWGLSWYSCTSRYDRFQFEKDFPVLLKNEYVSNYFSHCPEYINISF